MNRYAGTTVLMGVLILVGEASRAQESPARPDAKSSETANAPDGSEAGDFHVRIVRLSNIRGQVGMDRGKGRGVEPTMQNVPIVEGMKLGTADGYAEVEFEDHSRLRLTPSTVVEFPLLVLRKTGAKASAIRVETGTVYVNLEGTKGNEFRLLAGKAQFSVNRSSHLRLTVTGSKAELAVFSGSAELESDRGPTVVTKQQTLMLDVDANHPADVQQKIDEGPYDAWEKDVMKYHDRRDRNWKDY